MKTGEENKEILENSELYKALAPDEQRRLLDARQLESFEAGEVIITEGEEGECFYLLESGKVEVSTINEGKKVVLATLSQGAIIGEVSLFSNQPRTATVSAVGAVRAVRFQNQEFRLLLVNHPKLLKRLQSLILTRAQATIQKLAGS